MLRNRLLKVFALLLVLSMILSSCTKAPTAAPTAVATQAPATTVATAAPTEVKTATAVPTTRKGGWLDEIDFSVISKDSAVTQIKAGAVDMYADGLAAADFPTIKNANMPYVENNGLQYSIIYNPGVCSDTKVLNPFSDQKIREATNWLYDRNYINQEVYAGANLLKFFPITTQFPMYANVADVAAKLEAEYAYNPDKASQIVSDEMTALGATKGADGKYAFQGKPVVLNFLIRTDSDGTRKPVGDYVANQLESIGFTVNRQYKTASDAAPIWQSSDPVTCQWNLYTGAWSATIIDREEKTLFQSYYTPESVQGIEPFTDSKPDPAFDKLANDLANGNFDTLEQRDSMIAQAMELALKDSLQVWLIDGKIFVPYSDKVVNPYDLAAGVEGAQIWPYAVRFKDQEGGVIKIGTQDLFADPYNPIVGSNWAFDQMATRATGSGGTMNDPYTGLVWPLMLDKATVTVKEGVPVTKTLDWVNLDTAPEIKVPADAYIDWNAKTQTFITVGEKYPDGLTSKIRSVVTYPADFYDKVTWHDGNKISAADFLMTMIMQFDRANPDSVIYDESAVPYLQSFQQTFKGFRIASTDPLTVEFYTDVVSADAELDVYTMWPGGGASNWVAYTFGEGAWDVLAIANQAEAAGEMAYSTNKSSDKSIEWTSFIGGPCLDLLAKQLDKAIAEKYIPYAPTLGKYITADEAVARYTNLKNWYTEHQNFWIGTGPYYFDHAYLTEKTLTLKHFDAYPDSADRWSSFGAPKTADASLDGPAQVKIGDTAEFTVSVTNNGNPYPQSEIKMVKFLVFDAQNNIVKVDTAKAVADGQYTITLSNDVTSKLTTGSDKLTVAVVPIPVALPTFVSINFVTLAP